MDNQVVAKDIESRIFTIRNQQVMVDSDLAELYGVETKRLNEQVKRNIKRFPETFMFQLSAEESENIRKRGSLYKESLRSQIATTKKETRGGRQYLPYVFTEQGVAMLSAVLRSDTAVQVSIQIMNAFVKMRHFIQSNERLFAEMDLIKRHLIDSDIHQKEIDRKVEEILSLIDKYNIGDTQGIFFQGQIFDAYAKFESIIAQADHELILIDNYVDLRVLQHLTKKKKDVNVVIYTDSKTKLTELDVDKFNAQYPLITINYTTKVHDRFLIVDNKILYHIGASLKDLGKKCFAFEVMDPSFIPLLMQNI